MKTIEEAKKFFLDYVKANYSSKVIGKSVFFDLGFEYMQNLGEYGYFSTEYYHEMTTSVVKWIENIAEVQEIKLVRTENSKYEIIESNNRSNFNQTLSFKQLREELEQTLTVFRENFSITYSENIAVYTLSLNKDLLFIVTLNNDKISVLDTFTSENYTCLRVSDVQERIFEITKSKIRMELSK